MAKRQGGELNHENWNADEVPEEAGQFRQAGQAALAGRVIKTARRRRPVGGEEGEAAPKSAFAGFGGFSKPAPGTDATAAFSFIGKSPTEASAPSSGGFAAFGSTTSSPSSGAFSFGSTASKVNFSQSGAESDAPAAKKSSVFGNFGSSAEEQKPTFGSAASEPKSSGFGAFSFGAKTEDKPPPPTQPGEVPKSDLMSMFKPTGWACDTCMVSNPSDKTSCLACEAPKPGSKPAEKPAVASSGFSFGAVTSTANAGGFSFGAASNKVEENKENNAGSGFSFGSKNVGSEKAGLGAFQFGSKSAGGSEDAPPAPNNGGFSFGAKSSDEDTAKNVAPGGFSFGAKTSTEDPPKKAEVVAFFDDSKNKPEFAPSFSFGAKPVESAPSESFSFGNTFSSKPVEDKVPEKTKIGGEFSFGAKPSTEIGGHKTTGAPAPLGSFAFGAAATVKPSAETEKKANIESSSSSEKPSGFNFGASKTSEKTSSTSATSFGTNSNSNSNNSVSQVDETSGSGSSGAASPTRPPPSKEYLAHLKALNMQVASWINKHLEQNPLVLLTPVFKDYTKHLDDISEKYKGEQVAPNKEVRASFPLTTAISSAGPAITSTTSATAFSLTAKSTEVSKPQSGFGGFGTGVATDKPAAAAPFSFGLSTANNSTAPSSLPAFAAFGSNSGQQASTTASSGFSFGNLASAPPPAASEAAADEDEDAPPVVEVKQVTEDDAKYSKKCKLFFKKDGSYVEKGVGMLYIKPVEGEKHQLLIRADTNLGNVLLNILLSSQIPTTRVGKNNVMLVCVPNPPVDPKATEPATPCPMLIRVKDGEAADELKAKIEECSGK